MYVRMYVDLTYLQMHWRSLNNRIGPNFHSYIDSFALQYMIVTTFQFHIHTYIHTYIHTCKIHTCIQFIHTYIHTYMHTVHTYVHTYIHTCIHVKYIHAYSSYIRKYSSYIHAYIHTVHTYNKGGVFYKVVVCCCEP